MNAPIKFSTQKGEGGTVGYSVMTILLLYRLLSSGISDFTDKGGEMDLKLSLKSPKPKGHNTTRTK